VDPELLDQPVDLPGPDAVDIRVQHDRDDRLLRTPPRLQEAREVRRARALLGDQQPRQPWSPTPWADSRCRLCRALDEQVELFRQRPLDGTYPYLWLGAKQLKVRDHGHVRSKAAVIAYAVHESGSREIIGLDLGEIEPEASWLEFLRSLKARGLEGVKLVVSDHHEGLRTPCANAPAPPERHAAPGSARSPTHCSWLRAV
jgi:hypothetical protein